MPADHEDHHPVVDQVRLLADQLVEARALIDYLLTHVRRLADACRYSSDERLRDLALDYRDAALRRTTAAGMDPDWAVEPRATLLRSGPPPQAKLISQETPDD
jgi:hypothetical protein